MTGWESGSQSMQPGERPSQTSSVRIATTNGRSRSDPAKFRFSFEYEEEYRSEGIPYQPEPRDPRAPGERRRRSLDGPDGLWASDSRHRTADLHGRTRPSSLHLPTVGERRSDPLCTRSFHPSRTAPFGPGLRMSVSESRTAALTLRAFELSRDCGRGCCLIRRCSSSPSISLRRSSSDFTRTTPRL